MFINISVICCVDINVCLRIFWEIILVKKKMYKYNLGLKKSGGGGKRGGGDGKRGSGGGGCRWLWLLFIVVDILFYCNRYIILL